MSPVAGNQVVHVDDETHALAALGAIRAGKKLGRPVTVQEYVSQLVRDAVKADRERQQQQQ
jgi:hypothetical protein